MHSCVEIAFLMAIYLLISHVYLQFYIIILTAILTDLSFTLPYYYQISNYNDHHSNIHRIIV